MTWDKLPWGTILAGIIVVVVAIVGGGVVLFTDDNLSFKDYTDDLSKLAVGVGLVSIGRGVTKAGAHIAKDDGSR